MHEGAMMEKWTLWQNRAKNALRWINDQRILGFYLILIGITVYPLDEFSPAYYMYKSWTIPPEWFSYTCTFCGIFLLARPKYSLIIFILLTFPAQLYAVASFNQFAPNSIRVNVLLRDLLIVGYFIYRNIAILLKEEFLQQYKKYKNRVNSNRP